MNAFQKDIINLIKRHGPMTSAQLQDRLNIPEFGYNFELEHVSKTASKMKSNGLLTGEDRPNPGTKPVRYWALQPVAEVEKGEWSDAKTFECQPEQAAEVGITDFVSLGKEDFTQVEKGAWSDAKTFECQPEQVEEVGITDCVIIDKEHFTHTQPVQPGYDPSLVPPVMPSKPMSSAKILREFANLGFDDDRAMGAFMEGIAAAERYHGIAE